MTNILRNWFVPKDGINRSVISAEIQKYLGNDATVRPGKGPVDGAEVDGYWIRAYRNLTTEMINDLRIASERWDQEQRRSGRRGTYEESVTFRNSGAFPTGTNSPSHGGAPFQPPMPRATHPPEMVYQDPRMYPAHSGPPPVTSGYMDPPGYAPHPSRNSQPGYPPQEYYGQPSPYGMEQPGARSSPPYVPQYQGSGHYGMPQARDSRDDLRYHPGHAAFQDPRMATYNGYPAVSAPPNGLATSPPQSTSSYEPPGRYDQYGRPVSQPPPEPYRPSPSVDVPIYRERPGVSSGTSRRR